MRILALIFALTIVQSVYCADAKRGQELYASCIECHGENGRGIASQEAPRIAGQHDWYILLSLKKFVSGERKNPKMLPFIKNLSQKDFEDLAAYISQMK